MLLTKLTVLPGVTLVDAVSGEELRIVLGPVNGFAIGKSKDEKWIGVEVKDLCPLEWARAS